MRRAITFLSLTALALLLPVRLAALPHPFTPEAAETAAIALLGAALFYASIFLRRRRAMLTSSPQATIIEPVSPPRNPANAARAKHAPTWKKPKIRSGAPPPATRFLKCRRKSPLAVELRCR